MPTHIENCPSACSWNFPEIPEIKGLALGLADLGSFFIGGSHGALRLF